MIHPPSQHSYDIFKDVVLRGTLVFLCTHFSTKSTIFGLQRQTRAKKKRKHASRSASSDQLLQFPGIHVRKPRHDPALEREWMSTDDQQERMNPSCITMGGAMGVGLLANNYKLCKATTSRFCVYDSEAY